MGYRLHTAERYDVSYLNSPSRFNHMIEEINTLINELCIDNTMNNEFSDEFDVPRADFEKMIETINTWEELPIKLQEHYNDITGSQKQVEEFVKDLKALLDNADKRNDCIHFCWF